MIIKCAMCGKPREARGQNAFILKTCGRKKCKLEYRHRFYGWTKERREQHSKMAIAKGYGKWMLGKKASEHSKKLAQKRWQDKGNPNWVPIGSRHTIKHKSYWAIKVAERKWIKEHDYIMEKIIARKLYKYEHVHHIDGNGLNNAKENLQLLTKKEHAKIPNKGHFKKGQTPWNKK